MNALVENMEITEIVSERMILDRPVAAFAHGPEGFDPGMWENGPGNNNSNNKKSYKKFTEFIPESLTV